MTVKNLIGIYIVGWFLTFGYFYNTMECRPAKDRFVDCTSDIGFGASIGATIWPIYWAARASIFATKDF